MVAVQMKNASHVINRTILACLIIRLSVLRYNTSPQAKGVNIIYDQIIKNIMRSKIPSLKYSLANGSSEIPAINKAVTVRNILDQVSKLMNLCVNLLMADQHLI